MSRKRKPGGTPPAIDDELRALCPPLSNEERTQLRANLEAEGCRDPLVVWDGLVLDGHNRLEICAELELPYKTVAAPKWVKERKDALTWIANNQLGRRNITGKQASYLRGRLYLARRRQVGRPEYSDTVSEYSETAEQVAAQDGTVSSRTVERDAAFAKAVDVIVANCGEGARPLLLARGSGLSRKDVHELAELTAEAQVEAVSYLMDDKPFRMAVDVAQGLVDPETGEPIEQGLPEEGSLSSPPQAPEGGGPAPGPENGAPPPPEPPGPPAEIVDDDPGYEGDPAFRYHELRQSLDTSDDYRDAWREPAPGDRRHAQAMDLLRQQEHTMAVQGYHSRLLVYLLQAWREAQFQATSEPGHLRITPQAIAVAVQVERLLRGSVERTRRLQSWDHPEFRQDWDETRAERLEKRGIL